MQTVLDLSLNNGAIKVQQMEGRNAFYSNLLAFGVGAPTGVDIAGENTVPVAAQSSWRALNYATASYGQGVVTTPLEMLAAINTVGNGGVWVQPHAVDAVVDPSTGKATPLVPQTRRVIAASTANTLAHMMVGVVDDRGAEGFNAQIAGYKGQIAGQDRHRERSHRRRWLRQRRHCILRGLHAGEQSAVHHDGDPSLPARDQAAALRGASGRAGMA